MNYREHIMAAVAADLQAAAIGLQRLANSAERRRQHLAAARITAQPRLWRLVGGVTTPDPAALVESRLPGCAEHRAGAVRRWLCGESCVAEAVPELHGWRLFFAE